MQPNKKENKHEEQTEQSDSKPVCFFCNNTFQAGETIVIRKAAYYHRACYDTLFTIKSNQIIVNTHLATQ